IYCNASHKLPILEEWMNRHDLKPEEVAYMGDDIPDLQCMRAVGLSCAPHDAAREVLEEANYISKYTGGYGCARDIIQQILSANDLWITEDSDYIW
ncbi:MAG: HAD hydrolase family protein, partial [Muribaculaceae bacterium]|nr:HAD hydrolase family protein [Muribaculaceae bacterium]